MIKKSTIVIIFIISAVVSISAQVGTDDTYLSSAPNNNTYLPICSETNDKIVDLMVIPQGGIQRLEYTKEQLKPYVYRWTSQGEFQWLFDGFLFYEDRTFIGEGHAFEQKAFIYSKDRARKSEWEWLLNRVFAPGVGMSALNEVIDDMSKVETAPKRKRKIILSIPEAMTGQFDWGELNGAKLDFAIDSNRVEAIRWYIDELIDRFDSKQYAHLELSGFYWLRDNNELSFQLMPIIASYIRSKGYKFYWRPSYRSHRGRSWRTHRFDAVYLKPDHLTTSAFEKVNVERACTYASLYNMGLEIDLNQLVIQYSNYRTKFNEYIEVYSAKNVLEKAAMSYQDGDAVFHKLSNHTNPDLKNIYNKVMDIVNTRQTKADNSCINSYVQDIRVEDGITAYYNKQDRTVAVVSLYPISYISIHDLMGSKLIERNFQKSANILEEKFAIPNFKGFCVVTVTTHNNEIHSKKIIIN